MQTTDAVAPSAIAMIIRHLREEATLDSGPAHRIASSASRRLVKKIAHAADCRAAPKMMPMSAHAALDRNALSIDAGRGAPRHSSFPFVRVEVTLSGLPGLSRRVRGNSRETPGNPRFNGGDPGRDSSITPTEAAIPVTCGSPVPGSVEQKLEQNARCEAPLPRA